MNHQNGYKETLKAKQAEIEARLRRIDRIAVEKAPDALDDIQLAQERDLAILHLDREAILLSEVRAALERLATGGYGVCAECGEPISPKRLAAVPWTALCLRCQEAADARRGPAAGEWRLGKPASVA